MPFWKPSLSPTKILVALSVSLASTLSVPMPAAACQAGNPACVLPVRDPPPAAVPSAEPGPVVDDDGGFGFWPFLIGLAALAALILLLSGGGDDDAPPISP